MGRSLVGGSSGSEGASSSSTAFRVADDDDVSFGACRGSPGRDVGSSANRADDIGFVHLCLVHPGREDVAAVFADTIEVAQVVGADANDSESDVVGDPNRLVSGSKPG